MPYDSLTERHDCCDARRCDCQTETYDALDDLPLGVAAEAKRLAGICASCNKQSGTSKACLECRLHRETQEGLFAALAAVRQ
jgi:hypothetical protein